MMIEISPHLQGTQGLPRGSQIPGKRLATPRSSENDDNNVSFQQDFDDYVIF